MIYTVTLTDAENLALTYAAIDQHEWINNVVHERCRIAIDEIVGICVESCIKNGIQIPSSKEEMVKLAFEKKWVKSIYEQQTEVSSGSLQG